MAAPVFFKNSRCISSRLNPAGGSIWSRYGGGGCRGSALIEGGGVSSPRKLVIDGNGGSS